MNSKYTQVKPIRRMTEKEIESTAKKLQELNEGKPVRFSNMSAKDQSESILASREN